ncbi:MAG: hypothetical protein WCF09_02565, partial [Gallionella sp.]
SVVVAAAASLAEAVVVAAAAKGLLEAPLHQQAMVGLAAATAVTDRFIYPTNVNRTHELPKANRPVPACRSKPANCLL